MTLSQFNCPHCHNLFQVDTSLPAVQVGCPHCQQPVDLNSEPPVVEPPLAEPPVLAPPPARPDDSAAGLLPPEAVTSPQDVPPLPAGKHEAIVNRTQSRHLAADERASRKFIKNAIVWVCCAIVLALILVCFL